MNSRMKGLCLLLALGRLVCVFPAVGEGLENDITAGGVEPAVAEETVDIGGEQAETGYADFVGEVSATGGVKIDKDSFPDEKFREYVRDELDDDGDGVLSEKELGTDTIDVGHPNPGSYDDDDDDDDDGIGYDPLIDDDNWEYRGITSLKGIELFPNLKYLYCQNNRIAKLDLRKNLKLLEVYCYGNALTTLNVSKCTVLKKLSCGNNKLTTLKTSNCPKLTYLICYNNQLTSLAVRKNTALTWLDCSENKLTSLNVSQNTKLQKLICGDNSLSSLKLSNNTGLVELRCYDNALKKLDVSGNTALKVLHCGDNRLTSLKLGKKAALKELYCFGNALASIDITNCTKLKKASLSCEEVTVSGKTWLRLQDNNNEYDIDIDPNTRIMSGGKQYLYPIYQAEIKVKASMVHTGEKLDPVVSVTLDGKVLKKGRDYEVANFYTTNIGTAPIGIEGIGKYVGKVSMTVRIVPQEVKLTAVTAGAKKIDLAWEQAEVYTYYQIQYATKKDFSNGKKIMIDRNTQTETTLKNLTANKTYYVRIRVYKERDGVYYYSKWSAVKSVKTK